MALPWVTAVIATDLSVRLSVPVRLPVSVPTLLLVPVTRQYTSLSSAAATITTSEGAASLVGPRVGGVGTADEDRGDMAEPVDRSNKITGVQHRS